MSATILHVGIFPGSHMKITVCIVAMLFIIGCGRHPRYYRQDVGDGYTYWNEVQPTTFHGICADMYQNGLWIVEHPYGHKRNKDGAMGSVDIAVRTFATKQEAEAWAERFCPTKARP